MSLPLESSTENSEQVNSLCSTAIGCRVDAQKLESNQFPGPFRTKVLDSRALTDAAKRLNLPHRRSIPLLRGGRRKTRVQPLPQDTCESTAGAGGMVVPRTRPARQKSFARSISPGVELTDTVHLGRTEVQWRTVGHLGPWTSPVAAARPSSSPAPECFPLPLRGRRSSWGYASSGWGPTSARFLARRPTRKRHGEPRLMH